MPYFPNVVPADAIIEAPLAEIDKPPTPADETKGAATAPAAAPTTPLITQPEIIYRAFLPPVAPLELAI